MSQMPDKLWLHKDTKYSTADTVCGYQYDFVQGIEDEGGIENFVEYIPKNMFIDKTCEWLEEHLADFFGDCIYEEPDTLDRCLKSMKKAMEE